MKSKKERRDEKKRAHTHSQFIWNNHVEFHRNSSEWNENYLCSFDQTMNKEENNSFRFFRFELLLNLVFALNVSLTGDRKKRIHLIKVQNVKV